MIPKTIRDQKIVGTHAWPPGVDDPDAYAVKCEGDCMAPEILDGDVAVVSPAVPVERGMIVTINFKDGGRGSIKRLLSDLPPPAGKGDEIERMLAFEMLFPPKKLLARSSKIEVMQACVGVYRGKEYISLAPLTRLEKLPRGHSTFVLRDDGFSPALRGGDFAVIDTRRREPVNGQLVHYRSGKHEAIVRLELPPQSAYRSSKKVEAEHPRPWWLLGYGRQRLINWQPDDHRFAPYGYLSMSDGPLSEKFLRQRIVGHVVGVLRDQQQRGTP